MAKPFESMTFLFTGKLKNMKREEAEGKVTDLGGKIASFVTKDLSVLVATSNTSAKWTAQELNSREVQNLIYLISTVFTSVLIIAHLKL